MTIHRIRQSRSARAKAKKPIAPDGMSRETAKLLGEIKPRAPRINPHLKNREVEGNDKWNNPICHMSPVVIERDGETSVMGVVYGMFGNRAGGYTYKVHLFDGSRTVARSGQIIVIPKDSVADEVSPAAHAAKQLILDGGWTD